MSPVLIGIAKSAGIDIIRDILEGKIGKKKADLAITVVEKIADQMGVPVAEVETAATANPAAAEDAMLQVAPMAAEMVALYAQGLEGQFELLQTEMKEPWFAWAWRPAWMWGLLLLWSWAFVVVPLINAIAQLTIVAPDVTVLMQLTGVFLALYMGGHTIKDFVSRRFGAGEDK